MRYGRILTLLGRASVSDMLVLLIKLLVVDYLVAQFNKQVMHKTTKSLPDKLSQTLS